MLLLILASLFLSVSISTTVAATVPNVQVSSAVPKTVGNQTTNVTVLANDNSDISKRLTITVSSTTTKTIDKNQTDTVTTCDSYEKANHTFLQHLLQGFWCTVQQPQVIIAFVTGVLLSATICCLARLCHRKKRRSENFAENMEMVTTEAGALIGEGQAVEFNDGNHDQAAEAAGTSDGDQEFKEVEYSDIMFRASECSLTEARDAQDPTETEYAEIKKGAPEERQDDGGEGGEVLEDNGEGEEEMVEEELETGLSVSAGEGAEDGEVVSSVT